MMEAIVTATIFSIAFLGIYVSLSMIHPTGSNSMEKLKAAYVAKTFMDSLHQGVRADMWSNGIMATGSFNTVVNGYAITYNIADVPGLNLRQVNVMIDF